MINSKKLLKCIMVAIASAILLVITVEFNLLESEFSNSENLPFKVILSEARAQTVGDYEMTTEDCWETGEPIEICRAADWYCDVGAQDTCGPDPDPGEN
jgi:hypothetical protein